MDVHVSFADRLKTLRDWLDIKREENYLQKMGITRDNFKSYSRGSQPSLDKVAKILSSVEGLRAEWLVKGSGKMFKDEPCETLNEPETKYDTSPQELISIIKSQQGTIADQAEAIKDLLKGATVLRWM